MITASDHAQGVSTGYNLYRHHNIPFMTVACRSSWSGSGEHRGGGGSIASCDSACANVERSVSWFEDSLSQCAQSSLRLFNEPPASLQTIHGRTFPGDVLSLVVSADTTRTKRGEHGIDILYKMPCPIPVGW